MLTVTGLNVYHGTSQTLKDFSLTVGAGEVLCLLGRNGAGKTTALKAIMGLLPARSGSIKLAGTELNALPAHEVPRHGIGYVPQGRRLFSELTVRDNLEIGLMTRKTSRDILEQALTFFPRLRERLNQVSGTLSGGEQQMLATARALCIDPSVIMLDEPTEGLMPSMIAAIRDVVLRLRDQGKAILLVEQRVDAVLSVADRVSFVENGRVQATVPVDELRGNPHLLDRYVGIA
ncbi:ABC transporter ATP-binding protein [Rhizobium sp. SEMIA 4085]|uniref:Branched-chain amino acid ABC transporter ATP-binding protein n=1 Tax=Rhizobium gallicum bv. gallicum R602sp TaxID=1041138 RepID=A0A0B4XGP4_9HYPH|nr:MULTISPECIES: ABC transporter ATP-binding protein [Rhizobium]AJD46251.1 branched-chain amino acid ABC transporter ATP-binding protein [Rhizobium gallicum bv. gallicum R602sp]NNH29585.1 ABC transporter ATP-binding protein [Rhizobium sp. SEMIA 4085]TDW19837.1 amino acid/amide ABC transporter ATP-binding protein 2 (HAAT family) [Rhizobium azibense]